jgi:hypothetical protein
MWSILLFGITFLLTARMRKLYATSRPLVAALLSLGLLVGYKNSEPVAEASTGSVVFMVANVVGSQPLVLNRTAYTTPSGEALEVNTFKYYLSNIQFKKADGTVYAAPDTYFLVDQAKAASQRFSVTGVPAGDYTGVSFLVGVDAQKTGLTDPLAFTGKLDALNPANNMYWTWNSGHIFLKLEGMVTSADGTAKPLTCHVGGYAPPYNAIVTAAPSLQGATLPVRAGRSPELRLQVDLLRMFDGVTHVSLRTFPGTHRPSSESVAVAQNYAAGMFSVQQVVAN